jgi:hypothetical protein
VLRIFVLPLKILVDENLVLPRLPADIINKRAYPMSILWGRGLMRWNGRRRTGGWHQKPFDCCILFFILPLKKWPRPPDDIINKRAYPTLDLLWGRGLSRWNGHRMTGGGAESQFDCRVFFGFSPYKCDGRKFSLSAHPR